MKRSYREEVGKLVDLETFDTRAFVDDDKSTQECCDFVLALAVAFNDIKGLLLADYLLLGEVPTDQTTPTSELGSFAGLHLHFFRLLLGATRELLYLVKNEPGARQHPLISDVVKKLPKANREAWRKLVTAADASASADPDIRFLIVARNTVAYHYAGAAIGKGYRRAFANASEEVFISRGSSISTTRFYFADRAVQSYLQHAFDEKEVEKFFLDKPPFISDIAIALYSIVTGFITARGAAWRRPRAG